LEGANKVDIAFNTQEFMKLISEHPSQAIIPAITLGLIITGIVYGFVGMRRERKQSTK